MLRAAPMTPLHRAAPLRDGADFAALARDVLGALGIALAPPDGFPAPTRVAHDAPDGRVVRFVHTRQAPDPYAGGPVDTRSLSVERDGAWLRVSIEEVAWVGDELTATGRAPAGEVAAVEAAVDAFVARWGR